MNAAERELDAMAKMASLIEPLEPPARSRAVSWLIQSFGIELGGSHVQNRRTNDSGPRAVSDGSEPGEFESLAELFHAASPKTDREKALVVAYWIQKSEGSNQFAAQQVNSQLKHLGFGVSNITDALSQLMSDKPSPVIQLKKSGTTRQARKLYKVTDAGYRKVAELLSGQNE